MSAMPAATIHTAERAPRALSPSQVNTYLDCPARWYYGAVLQLPDPPTGALALGQAVHHVARIALEVAAAAAGDPLTGAEIEEAARAAMRVSLEAATLREDEDAAALTSQAVEMAQLFGRDVVPTIERPAQTEMQLSGRIGAIPVNGIADILTPSQVVDLKTASKKPGAVSPAYRLQLATYAALTHRSQARLVTIARTKPVSWCQHTLPITEADAMHASIMYATVADAMATGIYPPRRSSFVCSRRHCAYWRRCQADYGGEVPG